MPEAAVDEHDEADAREHYVGTSGQMATVQTVTDPPTVKSAAQRHLGPRVAPSQRAHELAHDGAGGGRSVAIHRV